MVMGACKVVGWSRQAANYVISSLPFHRRGTHSITPAPHNFACSHDAIAQGGGYDSKQGEPAGREQCGELLLRTFLGAEHDEHIDVRELRDGQLVGRADYVLDGQQLRPGRDWPCRNHRAKSADLKSVQFQCAALPYRVATF